MCTIVIGEIFLTIVITLIVTVVSYYRVVLRQNGTTFQHSILLNNFQQMFHATKPW